ncbi:hydroxymethylglutaryl-CoA lyase [Aquibium sp. LZ166]|uniref:Hydroxymethylglutaryl-CoA lyase n=1 Tax=Aquibium pacificus TaxID=3153579 RepID=A0ABV3SNA5_9HYPH
MRTVRPSRVEIVEVGPRDGYQSIVPFIPTARKISFLRRLVGTGLRRVEIGSFVSERAIPQLRDTAEVLAACRDIEGIVPQVLTPNEKYGRAAVNAGSKFVAFVLSVSEAHNRNNVRRHPRESVEEYRRLIAALPDGVDVRLNLATSFDCPFDGRVAEDEVIALLDDLVPIRPDAEICLCDTTGRAAPDHVDRLFARAMDRFPEVSRWALHAHDTYGLGLANVYAAWNRGVPVFDASFAGLGGCPFAPGATGNVATEDLVWMFRRMGVETGIDLDALVPVACDGAEIPGGLPGGRVRHALSAARTT